MDLFEKLKPIPIYMIYISTFGLAALGKLVPFHGQAPDWFQKQFADTFLNAFPGALTIQYYAIAALETLVTLGFIFSLLRGEFMLRPNQSKRVLLGTLLFAQAVFAMLGFGLRLIQDYRGAAELFAYFGVTLIVIGYVEGSRLWINKKSM